MRAGDELKRKLKAIADTIRGITCKQDKMGLDEIVDGIEEVYDVGHAAGYVVGHEVGYKQGNIDAADFNTLELMDRTISSFESSVFETIGDYAFAGCKELVDVSIPKATTIGISAFDCSNREFEYNDYDGYDVEVANPESQLQNFYAPSVTTVGDYAFYCCNKFENVQFSSLKEIGKKAFACCKIDTLDWPLVETVGDYAFQGRYYKLYYDDYEECERVMEVYNKSLITVSLPNAKHVGECAFANNEGLKSVNLPLVETLGGQAFAYCIYLESVDLASVTHIPAYTFNSCERLSTINLPKVEKVDYYGFYYCEKLKEANLPELTSLGNYAFHTCSSLTTISMPKLEQLTGSYVFYYCSSLKNVYLPKLKSVSTYCFRNCTALIELDLPSVTTIAGNGFYGCSKLAKLILRNESLVTLSSGTAFTSTAIKNGACYIYVPRSLVSSYQSATNWSALSSRFRAIEDYADDGTITGNIS